MFQSSKGWPTFSRSHVDSTKLYSSNYLHRVEGKITKAKRSNYTESYIKYDPASNSFVGVSEAGEGTDFQLSSMSVVDDYYVILPDTTREEEKWTNEVVFGLHTGEPLEERIWSKLIGKQLMLQMQVGEQVVHFHPNNDKTVTTASQLWLSPAYRLTQTFEYLRDRRVTVDEEYQTNMFEHGVDFARAVVSGTNSPMNVRDAEGNYTDIIDTIRVTLYPRDSKIKHYYGIWADNADGVHVRANGMRYRDILVRTKTFHYGATEQKVVLIPERKTYNFSPLANQSEQITFRMAKVSSHQLLDVEGHVMGEVYLSSTDVTSSLALGPGDCSLKNSGIFTIESAETNHVTLKTLADNTESVNHDTLLITKNVRVEGVDYVVTASVPLMQADLEADELVWSVVDNNVRYFIMAGEVEGQKKLIFRRYRQDGNTLYQLNTSTPLVKGSLDAANSDEKYITPWKFSYESQANQQLKLYIESPVNLDFLIASESTPTVVNGGSGDNSSTLTYRYAAININDNANFEEMVRLKYGVNSWLKFQIVDGLPTLTLQADSASATIFSWTYLHEEYSLLNHGDYPNKDYLEFGYNNPTPASITTRYKARKEYSMLLNNTRTYCGRVEETNLTNLGISPWLTHYTVTKIEDSRFTSGASGLSAVTNSTTLQTVVTPTVTSPTGTTNIVDTLDVQISLQSGAPNYRFADKWSSFKSVEDAHLKIPLIRKAYHTAPYDSLICVVENDEYNYTFPNTLPGGAPMEHTFYLGTQRHVGTNIFDTNNRLASYIDDGYTVLTKEMKLGNPSYAEIRLMDQFGNTPSWCELTAKGDSTLTVRCKENGIRAPRTATLYIAYTMQVEGAWRYVNFRLTVSQPSLFHYTNNQELIHTKGASGDDLDSLGIQRVHTNRRILYYYNPSRTIPTADQHVELPIRERGFYGWWRWYREGTDEKGDNVGDTDIPDSVWAIPPRNVGRYNYPFRIIGDSVYIDEGDPSKGKELKTQGRYTVFHVPSNDYAARKNPPSKNAWVYPPKGGVATYAVDLSVYYDNLPLSMKDVNQIDTAVLDTMQHIMEPTLSLREIFELHPWTEMADTLDHYKVSKDDTPSETEKYMEDHEVMAPMGTPLLLTTEQRYSYTNLQKGEHSESLLGYYMRDDNWSSMDSEPDANGVSRQDTMIWCGGWDATCAWYTYNPKTHTYDTCRHTITEENDFLSVPAKTSMPTGQNFDTVYYCLRARSMKSNIEPDGEGDDGTVDGDYWFNICRYKIIYHRTSKYGPLAEKKNGAGSLISNTEIEQNYEVLERLHFDYNKPGTDYQVYPRPLPWEDASYGFAYPMTDALPDNRPHNSTGLSNLANMGEYNLINRIPSFGTYWHKMEQHGGAANGYMIYCDGMSSAGQVAALSIESHLCEGQKLYFSGYVGNPMNETGKTQPNFLFSVQGSTDGNKWEDITSYMTGNIPPSNQWYQIFFPIYHERSYSHFRVRVFNMASNDDGNDFIIDDLCLFATKPPLVAYQANTTCRTAAENDSITHVVLRLDYQGMKDETFNGREVYYTITKDNDTHFLKLEDGYFDEKTLPHDPAKSEIDTVYGIIHVPTKRYEPTSPDSIFKNLQDLINKFEGTLDAHEAHLADNSKPDADVFRQGYIYEVLDGAARPVMYIVHTAKMTADNTYKVRVSGDPHTFMSSICAMTSSLKIKNRMMLTIDGEEKEAREVNNLCSNSAYDLSLRIKGSLLRDSVAPIDINGSCVNDWLLYGDTAAVSSKRRYGYKYSDIETIIKDILRYEVRGDEANKNQFARNLGEISRKEMKRVRELTEHAVTLDTKDDPYDVIKHLVDSGYLTLYRSNLTASIIKKNDSLKYVIFPIEGTGSDALLEMNVDVCPTPILIKLKSPNGGDIPLTVGGFGFDTTALVNPSVILADVRQAYTEIAVPIDSIRNDVALDTIIFMSTNDPNYLPGIHRLGLVPDRQWITDHPDYYMNADTLFLEPAPNNNYRMQAGYSYNFGFVMKTRLGADKYEDGCPVGTVPVTISVVPDHLRWDPQAGEDGRWNNPDNWIGIDQMNRPLHSDARFAPLPSTQVVIPAMEEGVPYPTLKEPVTAADTVKQTHFRYNTCNAIRFLPGAAMGQPQLMAYNDVVVDMSMPNNKWALRSTPVTGMISGDLFMANADLNWETPTWEVGAFDATGRSYKTGNASYWLSLYNRSTTRIGNPSFEKDTARTADDTWSKVTNAMKEPLLPAEGWAVYSYTKSGNAPDVRLPKKDDRYYYYTKSGEKVLDKYEYDLTTYRDKIAGGTGKAGKLAFQPEAGTQSFVLTNGVNSFTFVFGNPTMSYLDIWGFIADNSTKLDAEIRYVDAAGSWQTATWGSLSETDTLSSLTRYLPPMHVIVLKAESASKSLTVNLKTNRLVTAASQCVTPRPVTPTPSTAPSRSGNHGITGSSNPQLPKGIMTITAVNPASSRCTSRLLLGQGFHADIIAGEDAVLTTVNIDHYTNNTNPATPFNIYAREGSYGLSIDLLDSIVNVPISFNMTPLNYHPVTSLWFTGVHAITGDLVLYDAFTDTERPIIDGIRLDIETPEVSHTTRYYIRRPGYQPDSQTESQTATGLDNTTNETKALKIIHSGHVYILRDGHVFTMYGQQIR